MSKADFKKCTGCKHITKRRDEWCKIAKDKPQILPCSQHNQYAIQREANSKRIMREWKAIL